MMTYTDTNYQFFEEALQSYLEMFEALIHANSQKIYFTAIIKGLFSSLNSVPPYRNSSLRIHINTAWLHSWTHPMVYSLLMEAVLSKRGRTPFGVKCQYCGRLGKRENCQIGVFLAYARDRGYGLVDCDLYIPQDWFEPSHDSLGRECHLPPRQTFSMLIPAREGTVFKGKMFLVTGNIFAHKISSYCCQKET